MRIIHLILGKANPDRMNGVNKLVFEMLTTQHALGFDVQLWGLSQDPVHNYRERNFQTVLFQMTSNKLYIHPDIKKAIKTLDPGTVFHLHGSFIPEFYHIGKLLTRRNIPYVYTPHGALAPAALQRSSWKKKIYFWLFETILLRNTACLIATGQSVYDNVDNLFPVQRKALIPNGQALIRQHQSQKREQLVFGFCGRIALEHKGLDLLLEGFKIFINKGGNAVLHFIGDGEEMPEFKNIAARLGLLDKLVFHGAQFGEDKFKLLSGFDVFVHSSRMEGFPAAVLEAAAIGLPLLVSKHTNVWDYIARYDCGLLIHPNTPENIALQMMGFERLYKTGSLAQMGENAQKMINEVFDWKAICMRLFDEYVHAAESRMPFPENLTPKTESRTAVLSDAKVPKTESES